MVSDEQHKLEIERFRAAAEHCQRELTRHDRALHGDMARLHELHQNELETQVRHRSPVPQQPCVHNMHPW
jgi:hypothetical protein